MTSTTGTKRKRMWGVFDKRNKCWTASVRKSDATHDMMFVGDYLHHVTVTWTLSKPTPKKARKTHDAD